MFPSITLFGRTISVYALVCTAGVLAAGYYACRKYKKGGKDPDEMILFLLICAVGVLLGGHVLYGLVNIRTLGLLRDIAGAENGFFYLIQVLYLTFGGSVFYGGLLGGLAAGCIYGRVKAISIAPYADIMAAAAPLFHAFGRLGCFLGGCCFGVECSLGFTYTHALIEEANNISRFPVQLVESFFNLLLFFTLSALYNRKVAQGRLFALYVLVYSIGRFALEFLRGDVYRGLWLGLSTSQWIAMALVLAASCALGQMRAMRLRGIKKGS